MSSKNNDHFERLLKERRELLEEYPEYKELQIEIDKTLDRIGDDPEKRAHASRKIMAEYISHSLMPILEDLRATVKTIANNRKKMLKIVDNVKNPRPQLTLIKE